MAVAVAIVCLSFRTFTAAGESKGTLAGKSSTAKVAKKKVRTLQELIDFALKKGTKESIPVLGIQHLGFSGETIQTINISYEEKETKDKYDHLLFIVYNPKIKPITPESLLWQRLTIEKIGSVERHEMHSFRSSMSGDLLFAARTEGVPGSIKQIALELSPEVKMDFQKDVDFLLRNSRSMKLYE
jgi:hypothetical protein